MSPKRLDRVAPPPVNDEWHVRFGTSEAAKGWEELCTNATAKTREAYELMRVNPRPREDDSHYILRGSLAARSFAGKRCRISACSALITASGPSRRSSRRVPGSQVRTDLWPSDQVT